MKLGKKGKIVACIVIGCFLVPFVFSGLFNIIQGIILMNKGSENAVALIVFGALFAIVALVIGGIAIASILLSKDVESPLNSRDRLYNKGMLMKATVGNVVEEPGTNLSKVFCYYEDKAINKVYRFISDTFSNNDVAFFREGMELDVYVNPHNENDYYVAIEHVGVTPVRQK